MVKDAAPKAKAAELKARFVTLQENGRVSSKQVLFLIVNCFEITHFENLVIQGLDSPVVTALAYETHSLNMIFTLASANYLSENH